MTRSTAPTAPGKRPNEASLRPVLLWLLLACPVALGQTYQVDDSGGPLTLSEDVAEAAEHWNSAVAGSALGPDASSPNAISFAEADLMGPDVVSATLVRGAGEGLRVWLHPQLYRDHRQALAHELGLLLGAPAMVPAETGEELPPPEGRPAAAGPDEEEPAESRQAAAVMSPLLATGGPEAPTQRDLAALAAASERIEGDFDGDGRVGLADLAALARTFGQRGVNLTTDLDDDGVVGTGDVERLRELYDFRPPAEEAGEEAD